MDREGGPKGESCYYSVFGIPKDASFSDIRTAYRKLALKWHPDRWAWNPAIAGEAKWRFQQIQEAYSVLSDHSKRSMYDAGLYDPSEESEEFCDFVQEMISMMNNVKDEGGQFGGSAKDVGGDGMSFVFKRIKRRARENVSPHQEGTQLSTTTHAVSSSWDFVVILMFFF